MKNVKFDKSKNIVEINSFSNLSSFFNYFYEKINFIFILVNFILSLYLLIQNKKNNDLIKQMITSYPNKGRKEHEDLDNFDYKKKENEIDMIGLNYPKILFEKFKYESKKGRIVECFCDFLTQLETKLIYLEKEINVTKINAFYTARTLYLKKRNVMYDDSNITLFHNIMSWLVIHKSTQLKGIASDKYLACKYVEKKIGKNLCPHRIAVYNNIEEINFDNLIKMGNVVLKISNGCMDNIFISRKKYYNNIEKIKADLYYYFNREYSLLVPEFFHFYSKKRIIIEKIFTPIEELYEFKFMIFNHDIKMFFITFFKNKTRLTDYFDNNHNILWRSNNSNLNIKKFNMKHLNELKSLAIKLSEDFPNFIRVDLYSFKNNIYLSELTFDSQNGMPAFRNMKYFQDAVKTWKRVDY